ncbi:MAG: hypothetical protein ACK5HS_01535 [Mycoplasmatales bacterium]
MTNKIEEYTITFKDYKVRVLNIGASVIEYSYNGHNIVLNYENLESYYDNDIYLGSIIGRTAGRIKDTNINGYNIPNNYLNTSNIHGNNIHHKIFSVTKTSDNTLECILNDNEGDFPGNALIKVIYTLTEDGLSLEINASSDKETLLNLTNHMYFNLNPTSDIMNHTLKIDSDYYSHLDENMFALDDRQVEGTSFDFRNPRQIFTSFDLPDNDQFNITKFIDHPFKLNGNIVYQNNKYKLEVESNSDYVIVYTGNYISNTKHKINYGASKDYYGICFETQKKPGNIEPVDNYYLKTMYKLSKKEEE